MQQQGQEEPSPIPQPSRAVRLSWHTSGVQPHPPQQIRGGWGVVGCTGPPLATFTVAVCPRGWLRGACDHAHLGPCAPVRAVARPPCVGWCGHGAPARVAAPARAAAEAPVAPGMDPNEFSAALCFQPPHEVFFSPIFIQCAKRAAPAPHPCKHLVHSCSFKGTKGGGGGGCEAQHKARSTGAAVTLPVRGAETPGHDPGSGPWVPVLPGPTCPSAMVAMPEPLPGLGAALGLEHPTAEQRAGAGWSSRGSVPSSSSLLHSRPSSIHLAGLKPNYQPMGSAGRGMVQRQRCPLAPRDGDGAIGSLMASPSTPLSRLRGGCCQHGGHHQLPTHPRLPQLPALLGGTSPPQCRLSVCLSASGCWVMDRQHGVAESLTMSWTGVPWGRDGDGTPLCWGNAGSSEVVVCTPGQDLVAGFGSCMCWCVPAPLQPSPVRQLSPPHCPPILLARRTFGGGACWSLKFN